MQPLTILFPSCGGEPTIAAIQSLRAEWPGPETLRIVGTDLDRDKHALVNVDRFVLSPRRDAPEYLDFLANLVRDERVDVLWINPTEEQLFLLPHRARLEAAGARVLTGPEAGLELFADKQATYVRAAELGLRVPRWVRVASWREVSEAAAMLGYPGRPVVFRVASGKGAIGLRILVDEQELAGRVFDGPPDNRTSLAALSPGLGDAAGWPPCMVTEYLPGREFDVDCLVSAEGLQAAVVRRNDAMFQGSSWRAETVDRPDLVALCDTLLTAIGWRYICSVTFREDEAGVPALLEVNPRMPSSINLTWKAGCNLPLAALQMCLRRPVTAMGRPQTGLRLVRYLGDGFLMPASGD